MNQTQFIRELDSDVKTSEKFRLTVYSQWIVLKKATPNEILLKYFEKCINKTIREARKSHIEPEWIGIAISTEIVSDDVYLAFRKINSNIANELLELFIQLPEFTENKKDIDIIGVPIQIRITVVKVR